jgi:GT2 family glycosyltransferase
MEGRQGDHLDDIMAHLFAAEVFLEKDLRARRFWILRHPRAALLRARDRIRTRTREVTSRRIGTLRHHSPEPLTLPSRYWRTTVPSQAPSISIVTPSFGQGQFIERTIHSVLGQSYPDLEYVVQDGGSTDQTVDILRHYSSALTHWESARDTGQADALNRGFAYTSGEIMAYLNSDDLVLPGSLAYVASYFASHPNVDVVYGHRVMIDDADRRLGIWVLPRHDDATMTLLDFIPQETLFWRRSVWDAVGGEFDTSFGFALDWDLLLRFRDAGARFARLPRFLGAFRVHPTQKTQLQQALCDVECNRLRLRVHGREVPHAEAVERVVPYLRAHVRAHLRQRIVSRMPLPRAELLPIPEGAWVPQAVEMRARRPSSGRAAVNGHDNTKSSNGAARGKRQSASL